MQKRTKLEYEATAMLLDMYYFEDAHTFCILADNVMERTRHFDADNLRELTPDEVFVRNNNAFKKGIRS